MGDRVAIIYRWRVPAEREAAFTERWRLATLRLRENNGGLGSCLTRNAAGTFVAIALWPDLATREAAFAAPGASPPIAGVEFLGEEILTVTDDLWLASGFAAGSIT